MAKKTEKTSRDVASIAAQVLNGSATRNLERWFLELSVSEKQEESDKGYDGLALLATARTLAGSTLTQRDRD